MVSLWNMPVVILVSGDVELRSSFTTLPPTQCSGLAETLSDAAFERVLLLLLLLGSSWHLFAEYSLQ